MRIRTKIFLLFLASMVTMGLVYFFVLIPRFIQNEAERIEKNVDEQMRTAERMIVSSVAPAQESFLSIAANLEKNNEQTRDDAYLIRQFDSVMDKTRSIENVFLLENGKVVLSRGEALVYNADEVKPQEATDWKKDALASPGALILSGPYQVQEDPSFYLTIATAITDAKGREYILAAEMNIDRLAEAVKGPRTEIGGVRGLIMGDGTLEAAQNGVTTMPQNDSVAQQIVGNFAAGEAEIGEILPIDNGVNQDFYYVYAHRMETTGWIIYLMISEKDVFSLVSGRSFPVIIAGGMLALAILAFLLVVIQLLVVRPLGRLQVATSYIAQTGDLSVTLHEGGKDELGMMARSYNKMVREIKLHRENLEKLVAERTKELKKLSVAVEQNPLAIVITDDQGEVEYINQKMAEMSGYTAEDLVRDGLNLLVPGWNKQEIQESIARAVTSGAVWTSDMIYQDKSGNELWINCLIAPVVDEHGQLVHCVSISSDITEQKKAYDALIEAKKLAEQAAKVKSDFLANMSHEIRTPMNAIIGLNSLLEGTDLNQRQQDYVQKMKRSSQSLLAIINDILDFSKIEAGKLRIEKVEFSIDEVVENISNVVGMKAFEKGLELVIDRRPDVPDRCLGDPLRLEQILLNLTSNAVKFTESGEVLLRIQAVGGADVGSNLLLFEVVDTGIGMNESQMAKLFMAFSQADSSTSRRYGGTGLGLAISHNMVELMGGQLEVMSQEGQGSRFFFSLPLGIVEGSSSSRMALPSSVQSLQMWIVEDNEAARDVYANLLQPLRTYPAFFISGELALAKARSLVQSREVPEVVIMDYRLPGLNGVETWQSIRAALTEKNLPLPKIVISTAYGKDEVLEEIDAAGIAHVLMKPVTRPNLTTTLLELMGKVDVTPILLKREQENEELREIVGARILLVEDNEINQQVARELLEGKGFWVSVAANGEVALQLLHDDNSIKYDLILMDLQMPVMDGYQATAKIRETLSSKELPIIALSADVMEGIDQRVLACGMQGHLAKPFEAQQLFTTLHQWIKPGHRTSFQGKADKQPCREDFNAYRTILHSMDVNDGLARLDGNLNSYFNVLKRFAVNQRDTLDLLVEQLEQNQQEEARRTIHTLKGVSGSVGATRVCALSKDVELRILQGLPADEIIPSTEFQQLRLEMLEVLREIGELVARCSEQQDDKPSLDHTTLIEKLIELSELLGDFDTRAEDVFVELRSSLIAAGMTGEAERLEQSIASYDFLKASQGCHELVEILQLSKVD